jgi:hypothetical protein
MKDLPIVNRQLNFFSFSRKNSVCLSFRLSVFPSFRLATNLSVCLPICLPICLSVCLSANLPVCRPICLPVCPRIYVVSLRLPTYLSVCLFVFPSSLLPTCLSVHLSVCLSACLPACQPIYLVACPCYESNGNRQTSGGLPQSVIGTRWQSEIGSLLDATGDK